MGVPLQGQFPSLTLKYETRERVIDSDTSPRLAFYYCTYYSSKMFYSCHLKLFVAAIFAISQLVTVFAIVIHLQPSLYLGGRAGSQPVET